MVMSFAKVGSRETVRIRIINGCRQNVLENGVFTNRSCAEREIVEVLASDAWHAVAENQAVPHDPLPGTKALGAGKPVPPPFVETPVPAPVAAEPAEVFGEEDEQEAKDDAADDRAEDAAAAKTKTWGGKPRKKQ